jgi:predicted lipid carrier protein YhbT
MKKIFTALPRPPKFPALPLAPLRLALRYTPNPLTAETFARVFSHALRGQALAERFAELHGKRINLLITDTGSELAFTVHLGGLRRSPAVSAWDARISGALTDLFTLISGKEDPDTLFFSRRLNLEGETETSLHIKNLLDAMEYDLPAHFNAVLGPQLGAIAMQFARASGIEAVIRKRFRGD